MQNVDVPTLKDVKDLSQGLLGRDVDVAEGDPVECSGDNIVLLGTYIEPDNRLGGVALLDLSAFIYIGAALGLLPPGGAEDMVDEKDPSKMVAENAAEFLNILAHPFGESTNVHQRLDAVYYPGDSIPAQIANSATQSLRRDVKLSVKGYGDGNLSMVALPG